MPRSRVEIEHLYSITNMTTAMHAQQPLYLPMGYAIFNFCISFSGYHNDIHNLSYFYYAVENMIFKQIMRCHYMTYAATF